MKLAPWLNVSAAFCGNPKGAITMFKLAMRLIVVVGVIAGNAEVQAQQPSKMVPRIGFLNATSGTPGRTEAFRQGLRELGYVDGKNIVIEWRRAEGRFERLPELAAELVRLKVAVIVTSGAASTRPAVMVTQSIPIVMAADNDPIGSGFVASLAHPGGNVTGLSQMAPELAGKRLELLKEILPRLTRVAVLGELNNPGNALAAKEMESAASGFRIQLQPLDVRGPKDIESGFEAATKARADALMVLGGPVATDQRRRIAELAIQNRLPIMYPQGDYIEAGGLMYYGTQVSDLFHRAATYVDKILKGAKPADLPVEQPKKFEFIVNLKAAKEIGLTIPPNVLVRADRVIR